MLYLNLVFVLNVSVKNVIFYKKRNDEYNDQYKTREDLNII